MVLSEFGLLFGISIIILISSVCMLSIYLLYEGKKTKAKLLVYASFAALFYGMSWLPELSDFLTILTTENNIDNSAGYFGLLGWVWLPPMYMMGIYLSSELLEMNIMAKWIIRTTFIIIGVVFELFLFLDLPNAVIYDSPSYPGERIIYYYFAEDHLLYYLQILCVVGIIIFCVIGSFYKSLKSRGVIRKKFFLFGLAYFLIVLFGFITTIIPPGIFLIIMNFLIVCSLYLFYFALREEPIKKEKLKIEKEIQVESGLFRLSKRPDNITEEEISLYKEKKICLVCKGKATGFNMFACPNCDSLYCRKCATALSDLENVCWVCNSPIDDTKPFKPYSEEQKELKLEDQEEFKPTKKDNYY